MVNRAAAPQSGCTKVLGDHRVWRGWEGGLCDPLNILQVPFNYLKRKFPASKVLWRLGHRGLGVHTGAFI